MDYTLYVGNRTIITYDLLICQISRQTDRGERRDRSRGRIDILIDEMKDRKMYKFKTTRRSEYADNV